MHTQETTRFGTYCFIEKGEAVRLLHSETCPALVRPSGYQSWYREGRRHRVGGPAVLYADGRTRFYNEGKLHNEDGPALTYPSGAVVYMQHGKLHNMRGPAIIGHSGECYWFVKGKRLTKEQFDQLTTSAN